MALERILIVEDEGVVAADLENILEKLGYEVVGSAPTGEKAVDLAEKFTPDLVLMDIRLKGEMDGIEAAEEITARFNIPVTYLTAYADETTLGRAKLTMPYGYILKPFQESDIRTATEVALYKHKMESMMDTIQSWHAKTLRTMPEAVVTADKKGRLTFMNEMAESLLGWKLQEVYGKPLDLVLALPIAVELLLNATASLPSETPVFLSVKDGRKIHVQYSITQMKDVDNRTDGLIMVFHPIVTEQKKVESMAGHPDR